MITGFNTDVRLGDIVFHVQTEDKGEKNPFIISLIYQKGLVLDSYRTPYESLLCSSQFSESLLRRILEHQHRQLLCAIKSGSYQKGMPLVPFEEEGFIFEYPAHPETGIVDGKKLDLEVQASLDENQHDVTAVSISSDFLAKTEEKEKAVESDEKLSWASKEFEMQSVKSSSLSVDLPLPGIFSPSRSQKKPQPPTVAIGDTPIPAKSPEPNLPTFRSIGSHRGGQPAPATPVMEINEAIKLKNIQGIEICLESSRDFIAGQPVEISLFVQARQQEIRLENVPVMIKVIGTNLSPRLYSGKTDKSGNVKLSFTLPEYRVGSAALILQASTQAGGDQVKYLIKKK
jgi:hypothetical protein